MLSICFISIYDFKDFFCYKLLNISISRLKKKSKKHILAKKGGEYLMTDTDFQGRHSLVIRLEDCQLMIFFSEPTCFPRAET